VPSQSPSAHRGDGDYYVPLEVTQEEPYTTESPAAPPPRYNLRPRRSGAPIYQLLIPKTRRPDGEFERLKGRRVAGGDRQDKSLNADMKAEVHMRMEPTLTEILMEIDPAYRQYLCKHKKLVVQSDKALYGFVESAKLWCLNISKTLQDYGFTVHGMDQCVFMKPVLRRQQSMN